MISDRLEGLGMPEPQGARLPAARIRASHVAPPCQINGIIRTDSERLRRAGVVDPTLQRC